MTSLECGDGEAVLAPARGRALRRAGPALPPPRPYFPAPARPRVASPALAGSAGGGGGAEDEAEDEAAASPPPVRLFFLSAARPSAHSRLRRSEGKSGGAPRAEARRNGARGEMLGVAAGMTNR